MLRRLILLALALNLGIAAPALAGGQSVTLRVLSYNIHGLPAIIAKDDPAARIPVIARRAGTFDIALFQEDFSFNDLVDANAPHGIIVRGNAPSGTATIKGVQVPVGSALQSLFGSGNQAGSWMGAVSSLATTAVQPFGSGLTTLAKRDTLRVVEEQRESFGMCEGYLGSAQDCFAEKGVLMVRLRLQNGAEVDVYNTHLEAGGDAKDQEIRVRQLAMIAEFMKRHSTGRAVVFGGDFNLDWKNKAHRAALEGFLKTTGLTRQETRQDGRQIDHILTRSGTGVALKTRRAGVSTEFHNAGKALSDHPALLLSLQITRH